MKYEVIYADPPWRYDEGSAPPNRQIENHYETMSLDEIKNMNVPSAKDCVLFMWTTSPKIFEAGEVLKEWGFTYKSQIIWDKILMGMGYWVRVQHEILLISVKGKPRPPPDNMRIRSIYRERRGKHSKKPDKLRRLIGKWYPEESKLEMFSRDTFVGWDVHGDEASSIKQTYLSCD